MPRRIEELEEPWKIPEVREKAEEIMQFIFEKSQEYIAEQKLWSGQRRPSSISDTGFLLRSGTPPEWIEPNMLQIEYNAPYAMYVEYGTGPHPVPPQVLIGWVRRKLGIKSKKAASVAWAIANKISKQGTQPKPFLRTAINDAIYEFKLTIKPIDIDIKLNTAPGQKENV